MGKKNTSKRRKDVEEVDGAQQEASLQRDKKQRDSEQVSAGTEQPVKRSSALPTTSSDETATYLSEVIAHFQTLVDDEERQLLVANVMEEIAGKEQKAASDPVCSRHIEALLSVARPFQLTAFLGSIMDTGGLFELAVSPFGSHVIEKILLQLESQLDVMSQEEYDAFVKVLEAMVLELRTDLWKFMMDRFATHVARRMLCMLCGHDVLPSAGRGPNHSGKPAANKAAASLAAKLLSKDKAAAARQHGEGCRFPELLESVVSVLTREDYGGASMEELLCCKYASPFVQAALKAASMLQGNRSLLATLIPSLLGTSYFYDAGSKNKVPTGAKLIEGVSADRVYTMCMDPTTSHVVEAVMGVAHAVPGLVDALLQRFFRGRLQDLAFHASANYVLQGVLAATTTPSQVQPLYEELAPVFGDLLRCRRSGVLATLLAACGRASCCQREACSALAAAITSMPQGTGKTGHEALAPCLLCLDSPALLGRDEPLSPAVTASGGGGEGRLSTLGAAILTTVLRFSQNACREFTDSLAALGLWDLARCARDPSGSRTLEAFLDGSAPAKMKQKLLTGMVGGAYAAMALTGSGSFLLERCFDMAEAATKEAIMTELMAHEREVTSKFWGPRLLKRLGAEAFRRDPLQWRRHLESVQKTKVDFEMLFGPDFGQEKPKKKTGKKGQQQQQHGEADQELEHAGNACEGPGKEPQGHGHVEQAQAGGSAQPEVVARECEEGAGNSKKSKSKKRKDLQQQQDEEQQQEEMEMEMPVKSKKKKSKKAKQTK